VLESIHMLAGTFRNTPVTQQVNVSQLESSWEGCSQSSWSRP
jgi:hypothetical protein